MKKEEVELVKDELRDLVELSKEDEEMAHIKADSVLCKFLETLGYHDVVKIYQNIDKYYS